jgi:predicted O-linked N-acetylglucosamine transferase (SPINDLY family)
MNKQLMAARQLAAAGDFAEAIQACNKLIRRGVDAFAAKRLMADCHVEIGMLHYGGSGLLDEAEAHFRAALAAEPKHAGALFNLGALEAGRGAYRAAIEALQAGLRLQPDNVAALEALARAQILEGELDAASTSLKRLAELVPANAGAYLIRDALLVPKIAASKAAIGEMRKTVVDKLAAIALAAPPIADPLRLPAPYFPLSYHGLGNREIVEQLAAIYRRALPSLEWVAPHVPAWRGPRGRIRIGLASHFFHEHSIGNTSRGLVEQLDRERFEVSLVRLGKGRRDAMAEHLDRCADAVLDVDASDLAAARAKIAALELDILFYQDIGMEPLGYFLAFARLAPVQAVSFGHPDTTGIPNVDVFISSDRYERPDAAGDYSERLVLLHGAGTLAYYHRPPQPAAALDVAALGIAPNERLYLCPQTLFKLHPDMDEVFAGILARDAAARIVLIDMAGEPLRRELERRFARTLGDAAARVTFVPSQPYASYLKLLESADVILDTIHFNGQNTTLEALALNMPVVTMPGRFQRGRHTLGMYAAMGFTGLVAQSIAELADLAVKVANDAAFRDACRAEIAARSGVLFENADIVRGFEQAFDAMLAHAGALQ